MIHKQCSKLKYIDTYDITVMPCSAHGHIKCPAQSSELSVRALLFLTRLCSDFVDGPWSGPVSSETFTEPLGLTAVCWTLPEREKLAMTRWKGRNLPRTQLCCLADYEEHRADGAVSFGGGWEGKTGAVLRRWAAAVFAWQLWSGGAGERNTSELAFFRAPI